MRFINKLLNKDKDKEIETDSDDGGYIINTIHYTKIPMTKELVRRKEQEELKIKYKITALDK